MHILDQGDNLYIDEIIITGLDNTQNQQATNCLEDLLSADTKITFGE